MHAVLLLRRLTGLVDVAQQLGDFDEASHRALRLLLKPLVVLPEALHLGLQHRLVFLLLQDTAHTTKTRAVAQMAVAGTEEGRRGGTTYSGETLYAAERKRREFVSRLY